MFARCIYIYIYLTSTIYWLKSKVTFRPRIPAYVNIIPIYFTARFRGFRCPTFLGNTVLNHTKYLLKISTTSLSHSLSLSLSKSTMLPDINHRGSYLDGTTSFIPMILPYQDFSFYRSSLMPLPFVSIVHVSFLLSVHRWKRQYPRGKVFSSRRESREIVKRCTRGRRDRN